MKVQNSQYLSIGQLQEQYLQKSKPARLQEAESSQSFQEILRQKTGWLDREPRTATKQAQALQTEAVKFSKHAASRLSDRNISLTDGQLERLNNGMRKAGEKGINESLVIMDQLAFIVSVPKNTVITAMDQTEARDNIFTNIDGAVII